jgi:gliding motility-associated-like protein
MALINTRSYLYSQALVEVCAGIKDKKYQTAGDAGSIFHWLVDGGHIVSGTNSNTITINWGLEPGNYTISVFEEKSNGCLGNTKKLDVKIKPSPVFNLGEVEYICEGEVEELFSGFGETASQYKFLWQDGSTNPSLVAEKSGLYWAEVTHINGCSFRDSVILIMNPLPQINLGLDTALCAPNELALDAGNTGGIYDWSNGDNSQTTTAHEGDGNISVKVTDSYGCSGFDTIQILNCPELADLIIPKVFTPNSGSNGNFWIIGGVESYPNITVKIYNRWGMQIYESEKGYPKPWDGKSDGKEMPMDAYYYIINTGEGAKDIIGSVTIVR